MSLRGLGLFVFLVLVGSLYVEADQPQLEQARGKEQAAGEPGAWTAKINYHEDLVYGRVSGAGLLADVAYPDSPFKLPAIISVHGGRWRGGDKRDGSTIKVKQWAELGFFAMSIDYRLVGCSPAPACYQDLQCAIRFAHAHADKYRIDSTRIFLIGQSAGGHLVSLAATLGDGPFPRTGGWEKASNDIRAVVSVAANYELNSLSWGNIWTPVGEDPIKARQFASPINHATKDMKPLLILHSDNDRSVPIDNALGMVEALKKARAPHAFFRYPEMGHMGINEEVIARALEFIREQSKPDRATATAKRLDAPRLPREDLLVYRTSNNEQMPVKSVGDWGQRRAEIVRGMESVMGKLPGDEKRCPFDLKIDEEVDCGQYIRRLVSFASEPGSRVPAYICIPKSILQESKTAPAVLCLHGTDNVIGHGVVVGLGRQNRQYASELAERGYVTIAPNYPLLAKYQPDLKALGWQSGTLKAVWDNMRSLDLLETLPYVKKGTYGAIGHSLGGHNAVYTSVFDERIKAVVSSCGLDSYLDYYDGDEKNWYPEKGWCQTRYMLRLAEYRGRLPDIPFDFHEMVGALAPRHVLIIAPLGDHNFRSASVDRVAKAARDVFKLYGHAERLRVEHPDCMHDFPPEMRQAAYEFLDNVCRS